MLNIKELRFKGIGRFVDEQSISFEDHENLIQVDGKNLNTEGSSGAGKSTIFNALDFLFGLNTTPNSVLQSRLTEDTIWVQATFDLDGQPLVITRSKKLKIELNGDTTSGSSKLSEEKLDQILAIPRSLFRPILHKKQGEKGFFLNFTPKETNDFLTDCLGLTHFKKHLATIDEKVSDLTKLIEKTNGMVEAGKAGLTACQNAMASLGAPPVKEVEQSTILALKAKADDSAEKLKRLLDIHKSDMAILTLNRPRLQTMPFDRSAIEECDKELLFVKKQILELESQEYERQKAALASLSKSKLKQSELKHTVDIGISVKGEAAETALEVKKIRESMCPTCEQTWITDAAKSKESQLLEKINKFKDLIQVGKNAALQLEELKVELDSLENQVKPMTPEGIDVFKNKNKELSDLLNNLRQKETDYNNAQHYLNNVKQEEFAKEQQALTNKQNIEAEQHRGQADLDRRNLESAVFKLKSYEDARVRYENTYHNLKEQEKAHEDSTHETILALESDKKDLEIAEELKRAVKSYLSCSFDEALETISESATRLVRHVPNMANATVQLNGTRETKDGKVKEEITAVLHLDGDENIDIRSLCGGERSAIDLAIDLSVIDLIESKTGKGINLFILDEPFTGMDTVCVEMALEVLKNSNPHKKIVVVDHNPIVKESISDRIVVVREKEISHISTNS